MPRIRVRLTFPPELIQQPIVYHLVKDFDLIPNIRRAEVKADYGWMALELEGDEGALERAVAWLKGRGVQVDPIARDVIVPRPRRASVAHRRGRRAPCPPRRPLQPPPSDVS